MAVSRRPRMNPNTVAKIRLAVYTRDGFRCRACGWEPNPPCPRYRGELALSGVGGPPHLIRRGCLDKDDEYAPGLYLLELDHIVPYSRGGPFTVDNLQALCTGCNLRKGAKVA
jgi:5-methylcytosine-specific restriction endonuclease McrA